MSGRVLNPRSSVPFFPWRLEALSGARRLLSGLPGAAVAARWRWRRFVVRRRRVLVPALLGACVAGWAASPELFEWSRGTVFSGRAPVSGQVVVRPLVGGGGRVRRPCQPCSGGCLASRGCASSRYRRRARGGRARRRRLSPAGGSPMPVWLPVGAMRWSSRRKTVRGGWPARSRWAGFAASRVDLMLSSCRGRWSSFELPRLP